jgi:hypothetical protein
MTDIDALLSKASVALRPLLEEAYSAGMADGRRQAANEFRSKIDSALRTALAEGEPSPSLITAPRQKAPRQSATESEAETRATPGTVKPTILNLIRSSPHGLTTREIEEQTGFKHNSVRGTVWALHSRDQLIARSGDRWVDAKNETPPADAEGASSDTGEGDASPNESRDRLFRDFVG